MCRGDCIYFSNNTLGLPKLFSASRLQDSKALRNDSFDSTFLMPFPPPPATAFISTGNPILSASKDKNSSSCLAPWYPGVIGTPAFSMRILALSFNAIFLMLSELGPIKLIPASSQASAKI